MRVSMSSSDFSQDSSRRFVSQDRQFQESGDFDYKPIPMTAAVSLSLAVFGISGLLTLIGIAFSLLGIGFGFIAMRKIKKSEGEYGGKKLAVTGFFLSTFLLMGGIGSQVYLYATELPEGHMRVNFPGEISALGFEEDANGNLHVPQEVKDKFIDKKVFLKGYMWSEYQGERLLTFVLLKDNGKCCFGGDPAGFDHMVVKMVNGNPISYREGLVSVAGTLRLNLDEVKDEKDTVYRLEATEFGSAKSAF